MVADSNRDSPRAVGSAAGAERGFGSGAVHLYDVLETAGPGDNATGGAQVQ